MKKHQKHYIQLCNCFVRTLRQSSWLETEIVQFASLGCVFIQWNILDLYIKIVQEYKDTP